MTDREPPVVPDPRTLLRKHGLHAKKSWGQNFLVEPRIHQRIVDTAAPEADDTVVEIGAGLGTLTAPLASRCARLVAIERDRELAAVLRQELGHLAKVEIVEQDALSFDYASARPRTGRLLVVGNLPYQIASPLLLRLLAARTDIAAMVVMLQLEMAQRIVAPPDTRAYGALTVAIASWAEVRLCFRVSRGAFFPPPKVDSAVIRIEPAASPRAAGVEPRQYERLVRAAFGKRRKTLRNALRGLASDAALDRALAKASIVPARRGETLSVEEFVRLSRALDEEGGLALAGESHDA